MRVFSFNRVIYDGQLTLDLFAFVIRQKFSRIFKMAYVIPFVLLYILKRIEIKRLVEIFYELLLSDLTITELNLFKTSNLYKIDLSGFGIVKDNPNDVIVSSEPSFLIELFIDRNKYNVICTEYDIRTRKIQGEFCADEIKGDILKRHNINRIQQLYIYTFKDKSLMKISDLIFIYRNHELIEYDTYNPNIKDKLYYNIFNQNLIIYLGISLLLLISVGLISIILSFFIDSFIAFLIGYMLWAILSFYVILKYIDRKKFNISKAVEYLLGLIPHFLLSLFLVILLVKTVGLMYALVTFIIIVISFPMLAFVSKFYKFG